MKNINVMFLGDTLSGKTHLIYSFLNIRHQIKPTLVDLFIFNYKDINFTIKDTGGTYEFEKIRKMSYLDTDVFVYCIDCTYFNVSKTNISNIKKLKKPIILVITKCDYLIKNKKIKNSFKNIKQRIELNYENVKEQCKKIIKENEINSLIMCTVYKRKSVEELFEEIIRISTEVKKEKEICFCFKF